MALEASSAGGERVSVCGCDSLTLIFRVHPLSSSFNWLQLTQVAPHPTPLLPSPPLSSFSLLEVDTLIHLTLTRSIGEPPLLSLSFSGGGKEKRRFTARAAVRGSLQLQLIPPTNPSGPSLPQFPTYRRHQRRPAPELVTTSNDHLCHLYEDPSSCAVLPCHRSPAPQSLAPAGIRSKGADDSKLLAGAQDCQSDTFRRQ